MTFINKKSGHKYTLCGAIHKGKQNVLIPVKSVNKKDYVLVSKFALKHDFTKH